MTWFSIASGSFNETLADYMSIEDDREISRADVVHTTTVIGGYKLALATKQGGNSKTLDPEGDCDRFNISPPKLAHIASEVDFEPLDLSEGTPVVKTTVEGSSIKRAFYRVSSSSSFAATIKVPDMDDYMNRRTMTPLQERINGFTMLAGALYGSYYCFSGMWLWDNVDQVDPASFTFASDLQCGTTFSWVLRDLHAMPPLPMIFIALGLVTHAPVSFVYHWHYCTTLPPGKPRFDHWSRKLDQAFIHVASAFVSYGTSGRWDYFALNVVYNAYCAWCTLISSTVSCVHH
jgi:hypothetical protein